MAGKRWDDTGETNRKIVDALERLRIILGKVGTAPPADPLIVPPRPRIPPEEPTEEDYPPVEKGYLGGAHGSGRGTTVVPCIHKDSGYFTLSEKDLENVGPGGPILIAATDGLANPTAALWKTGSSVYVIEPTAANMQQLKRNIGKGKGKSSDSRHVLVEMVGISMKCSRSADSLTGRAVDALNLLADFFGVRSMGQIFVQIGEHWVDSPMLDLFNVVAQGGEPTEDMLKDASIELGENLLMNAVLAGVTAGAAVVINRVARSKAIKQLTKNLERVYPHTSRAFRETMATSAIDKAARNLEEAIAEGNRLRRLGKRVDYRAIARKQRQVLDQRVRAEATRRATHEAEREAQKTLQQAEDMLGSSRKGLSDKAGDVSQTAVDDASSAARGESGSYADGPPGSREPETVGNRARKRSRLFPKVPARSPDRRHFGHRITTRSRAKGKNTLIDKTVDVDADVAAINAGRASRDAATGNWVVNGRTYGMHENGTVFPVRGPGFHDASRGAFKALGAYNEFGGATAAAKRWIAQRKLSTEAAAEGLRLHRTMGR
jgi:hypothetical protein